MHHNAHRNSDNGRILMASFPAAITPSKKRKDPRRFRTRRGPLNLHQEQRTTDQDRSLAVASSAAPQGRIRMLLGGLTRRMRNLKMCRGQPATPVSGLIRSLAPPSSSNRLGVTSEPIKRTRDRTGARSSSGETSPDSRHVPAIHGDELQDATGRRS